MIGWGVDPYLVVKTDIDTLLPVLSVFVDDHVIGVGRRHPGWSGRLCDAVPVCVAVAEVLVGPPLPLPLPLPRSRM